MSHLPLQYVIVKTVIKFHRSSNSSRCWMTVDVNILRVNRVEQMATVELFLTVHSHQSYVIQTKAYTVYDKARKDISSEGCGQKPTFLFERNG